MNAEDNPQSSPQTNPKRKAETTERDPDPELDPYSTRSEKSKGRFRFKKTKSSKSSSRSSRHDSHRTDRHHHRHRHHDEDDEHRRHRHHHHRRRNPPRSPSPGTIPSGPLLSPNTAFRESLFDALGDDEGAAFWESVYGQPIPQPPPGYHGDNVDGRRNLESMDEEEYASYVRSEMWKRTREGMVEEQERLRAEKRAKTRAERVAEGERERRAFERAMEESLKRGRERKRKREVWKRVWADYLHSWGRVEALRDGDGDGDQDRNREEGGKKGLKDVLFWPVESGKRRDVCRENVEEFMRRAPPTAQGSASGGGDGDAAPEDLLVATLKAERVRWHPDKIQHRYGTLRVDEGIMRSVTEVFQIIDDLWNETKK
ncbi:uncharacterized protein BJX67DRAFT_16750 [Aspergillus lucknowensis]|uniref:Uncharacterized protein n=1 Tax=Aspergillus lucknowensis TaxID=176173 RepID=A0ABR4M867_9EURO